MSLPIQDLATAFLALMPSAGGSPPLAVLDGRVPTGQLPPYALLYFYVETPDGLAAPDKVSLVGDSDVIEAWAYVHCVGANVIEARAMSGRVRAGVLNKTLVVTNRTCFPVRWRQGQPPQRDEETGPTVFDQVDVYGFTSVPTA